MNTVIDRDDMFFVLNNFIKNCGSQKEAAKRLGISPQYLNDLLMMRRDISDNISRKLGYARVTTYIKISQD